MIRALALLFLSASVRAAVPAAPSAYAWLERSVGPDALATLEKHGYWFAHRFPGSAELVHVQWSALEPLTRRSPDLLRAEAAILGFRRGREVGDKRDSLEALLGMPAGGLVTPKIRAAAALILEWLDLRPRLGKGPAGEAPMASQYWARSFVRRYNAASAPHAAGLAEPYFAEVLAAPGQPPEARAHLRAWLQARYERDVQPLLERDLRAGRLSEELRDWIEQYLADNRRALRAVQLPVEFAELFQSNELQRELAELRLAGAALSRDPSFLSSLRAAVAAPREDAPGSARLTGGEPHLEGSAGRAKPAPGDVLRWSAAYWVEGVGPRDSIPVRESVILDRGAGTAELAQSVSRNRDAGGPYVISFELKVADPRPLRARWLLQAPGARLVEHELRIEPSGETEDALARLADADSKLAACRLEEAAAAYAALDRPQTPASLGSAARDGRKRAAAARTRLAALREAVDAARADASPRGCAFATEHGERARFLLRELPAGCSRSWAGEVNELLDAAARRRRDQNAFWDAVQQGRRLASQCRFPDAVKLFSAGLAILDADPEARCGAAETEHKNVRSADLPRALAGDSIRSGFVAQLARAEPLASSGDAAAALATLNPMLARLAAQPNAACFEAERRRGEELAKRAGLRLEPSARASARGGDDVDPIALQVAREKERHEAENEPRPEASAPAAPPVAEQMVAPDIESGEKPAPEPSRRAAPASRKRS